MIRRLSSVIILALTTIASAQTYEYSGVKKEGFHAATLEETLGVIRQVTGSAGPHYQTVRNLVDQERGHTSLAKQFNAPMVDLLTELDAPQPIQGFYVLGHGEGVITVHVHSSGATLRYKSDQLPPNLYVKQIGPRPPPQTPSIHTAFLRTFLLLFNEEQKIELFRLLQEEDVQVLE